MNASRCSGSEVTVGSLVFPVFCFHFCTKHLGLDRAQWPVHFHAVPALCRDLHPWPCGGFSINPCYFLQRWKLPYCTDKGKWRMCCPRWRSEIKHWPKKPKQNETTTPKPNQNTTKGFIFSFQVAVRHHGKHLRISPVDVASLPQVPDLQDAREVRNSFCYRATYCCRP